MAGMGGGTAGMGGGMPGMGGMGREIAGMKMRMREMNKDGNTNVEQMMRMKEDLDRMMSNFVGGRRASSGGYGGGGDGSNFNGRASGRMEGGNFMGRASDERDGHVWRRGTPMSRGYGRSSGRYNF